MSPHSKSDLFLLKRYCISYPVNGGEWHFLSSLDGSNPWKARVSKAAGFNYTLKIGFSAIASSIGFREISKDMFFGILRVQITVMRAAVKYCTY